MSDEPTLSDEQLAEIQRANPGGRDGWLIDRLIAALRASRDEVGRLTQAVAVANAQTESAKARADAAEAKPERAV